MLSAAFGLLRALARDARGLALIEFAYSLPLFLGFGLVGLEFTSVVLARQKTERIAATLADVVASNQVPPNERQIGDMFAAVPQIARPFPFTAEGNVAITAVVGINDPSEEEVRNKIAWQRCLRGGSHQSRIGRQWTGSNDIADGPSVVLPNALELGQNQMVIVVEVFFPYRPMISQSLVAAILPEDSLFTETSVFRTRGQAIMGVTPVQGMAAHGC
jgi:Flp pilus assembly protein TadG